MIHEKKDKITGWESPILIHPGEHLFDFLAESGISQSELAERTGISKKAINEIVRGKSRITEKTAFRLSKVFSVSPEFWVNLQSNYDTLLAKREEDKKLTEDKENYLENFKEAYKELSKVGMMENIRWVESNLLQITKNLQYFFRVDSLSYVEGKTMKQVFLRKHNKKNLNQYTLASWIQLGENHAEKTQVKPFDRKKLKEKAKEIKKLSLQSKEKYLTKIEDILSECGVVFVCAPHLKNIHAQGLVKWVDGDKVLLMINSTKKDEGKFWFNLYHEIGHILLHGKKETFINFENDKTDKEEQEADKFAERMLVGDFNDFYTFQKEKKIGDDRLAVKRFAKEKGVSPAIVAGMLTHRERKHGSRVYRDMSVILNKECIDYCNVKV
jgi:HTH-type transcriptional regulator / antitoxin HigA